MNESQLKLEQLFKSCDTRGTGFIDKQEFHDLCSGFNIGNGDADIIFFDLDHDGDGRISFEDFSFGFRDFLGPKRRSSLGGQKADFKLEKGDDEGIIDGYDDERNKRSFDVKAWSSLSHNLGSEDVKKVLGVR